LFAKEEPSPAAEGKDFASQLAPNSMVKVEDALVEGSLNSVMPGEKYQFERQGYFCVDPDTTSAKPVFNQTVTLRDSWAKIERGKP
jgi:glutaminyl-tRNA synthetase